jgi:hypothetical protein
MIGLICVAQLGFQFDMRFQRILKTRTGVLDCVSGRRSDAKPQPSKAIIHSSPSSLTSQAGNPHGPGQGPNLVRNRHRIERAIQLESDLVPAADGVAKLVSRSSSFGLVRWCVAVC